VPEKVKRYNMQVDMPEQKGLLFEPVKLSVRLHSKATIKIGG
jgi:hypothetical protein